VVAFSPTSAAAAQLPPRATEDASAAGLAPAPAPAADAPRILLRANADSWLLVKDHGGVVLLNRVLKAGETWPVPARTDLLMTTGNAGGTDIVVDGAATPALGGNGAVRRDLPLDPDQIKDGRLAAAAVAPVAPARRGQ
jgi:cytoskeleton protein RodZ